MVEPTPFPRRRRARSALSLLLAPIAAAWVLTAPQTAMAASAPCDHAASPSGLDSNPGTLARPYRTAQKLADSLGAGETGCLRGGDYFGSLTVTHSGTQSAPITLMSFPGERATIDGKVWITDSANFVTIASLDLDGRNPNGVPSPVVDGDDVTFIDNEVTNRNTASCFDLGPMTYGRAYRTLIQGNTIHSCGQVPPNNRDHGIYVEHSTNARIVDNLIFDNANRGVQLYPDAQGTYVARNVIDANGEGLLIAGGSEEYGPQASSDNLIQLNLITNSTQLFNVGSYWGASLVGRRNVVQRNCIYGGARDGDNHGLMTPNGYTAVDNLLADPLYLNQSSRNYRLRSNSPCADLADFAGTALTSSTSSRSSSRASGRSSGRANRVLLASRNSAIRPGQHLGLTGRVVGVSDATRAVISVRVGGRWRRVARVSLEPNGSFSTKPRLRLRRSSHGASRRRPLWLRGVRLARTARRLRLRAEVEGAGRSPTIEVLIRGR